eukprot:TRINITY_DN302_c2_g3_i5.p1 TRINITY_DN302_c2_g3~~TRINITY_DN302_c2_g3_i5.p1  ORF type:complete len:4254 (+),score=1328.90 TRINITY_DN302_c2_g3_i5:104-12763(+)
MAAQSESAADLSAAQARIQLLEAQLRDAGIAPRATAERPDPHLGVSPGAARSNLRHVAAPRGVPGLLQTPDVRLTSSVPDSSPFMQSAGQYPMGSLTSPAALPGPDTPAQDALDETVPSKRRSQRPLPLLSPQQEQMVALDRAGAGASYNVPLEVRVEGQLQAELLREAWLQLLGRHEALRTRFVDLEDGSIAPVVDQAGDLARSWRHRTGFGGWEACEAAGREECTEPFDLRAGPVARCSLLSAATGALHLLVINAHHAATDMSSSLLLLQELPVLYGAACSGTPHGLPRPLPYSAYTSRRWSALLGKHHRGSPRTELARLVHWWTEELGSMPPGLELPGDRPAPPHTAAPRPGFDVEVRAGEQVLIGLRDLTRRAGTTMFVTLLTLWQVFLGRHGNQEQVVTGVPHGGRDGERVDGMVGYFVNTLPMGLDMSEDPDWVSLLAHNAATVARCLEHAKAPFAEVRAAAGPAAAVRTAFALRGRAALESLALNPRAAGASFRLLRHPEDSIGCFAKFDVTWGPAYGERRGIYGPLNFAKDMFDESTAQRFARRLEAFLARVAQPEVPSPSALPLCTAEEICVLRGFNPPQGPVPQLLLHELFEQQAAASPDRVVSEDPAGHRLTYAEMNARANRVARRLLALRPGEGDRIVPVCVQRRADALCAFYGVLKAGCAYLPIDPAYPPDRIEYMMGDSGSKLVVAHAELAEKKELDLAGGGRTVVCLDSDSDLKGMAETDVTPEERGPLSQDDLCYVIYTSGSTGKPKGVAMPHRGPVNLVRWGLERYRDDLGCTGAVSSFCFDASVPDLFFSPSAGGRVVLLSNVTELATVSEAVYASVNWMIGVPSGFYEVALQRGVPPGLSGLICGGEAMKEIYVQMFQHKVPRFDNGYGPTECSVACSYGHGAAILTIGNALPNYELFVTDKHLNLCPVAVPGELVIGGHEQDIPLARGYLGRPELTAERFPHSPWGPGRIYRTGDLVARRNDGNLRFLGRIDNQVKVRGFRIELGEVENAVAQHQAVEDCIVLVHEDQLVAFVTTRQEVTSQELRVLPARLLPRYMVPSAFVCLSAMPLMPNGKVNRLALQRQAAELPGERAQQGAEDAAPEGEVEEGVSQLFCEVLQIKRAGRQASFFELGGHSLLAMRFLARVRAAFGLDLPMAALHENDTVETFARAVDRALQREARGENDDHIPALEPVYSERVHFPLSYMQESFWILDKIDNSGVAKLMPFCLRLNSPVDIDCLSRSVDLLAERHEALRTVFEEVDGEVMQRAAAPRQGMLQVSEVDASAQREIMREEFNTPFQILQGNLVRLHLLALPGAKPAQSSGRGVAIPQSARPTPLPSPSARSLPGRAVPFARLPGPTPQMASPSQSAFGPTHASVPRSVPMRQPGMPRASPYAASPLLDPGHGFSGPSRRSSHGGWYGDSHGHSGAQHTHSSSRGNADALPHRLSTSPGQNMAFFQPKKSVSFYGGSFTGAQFLTPTHAMFPTAQERQGTRTAIPETPSRAVRFGGDLGDGSADPPYVGSLGRQGSNFGTYMSAGFPQQQAPLSQAQGPSRRVAPAGSVLLLAMHHLLGDAWSANVLIQELVDIYSALSHGGPPPELPETAQPAAYALWERGPMAARHEKDLVYWERVLGGVSPVLMPTDGPRRPTGHALAPMLRRRLTVSSRQFEGLHRIARRERTTLFTVAAAVIDLFFHKFTGEDDIAFGVPMAGRPLPVIENMVGCTVNTVVFRVDNSGDPTFGELVRRVNAVALEAASHQCVPFSKVVQRVSEAQPITKVMVNKAGLSRDFSADGISVEIVPLDWLLPPVFEEISVGVHEGGGNMELEFCCDSSLFHADTVSRLVSHVDVLLSGIVANPDAAVSSYGLCTEGEWKRMLGWNGPPMPYPQLLLHELFEQQAAASPQADAALDAKGGRLTYAELEERANRIARRLVACIGAPEEGQLVALCCERHVGMIAGVMGIIKAGCAYVPIDPAYPQERVRMMVDDAESRVVVTDTVVAQKEEFAFLTGEGRTLVFVDDSSAWPAEHGPLTAAERGGRVLQPTDMAYCLYTSGSTGRPKGAMIEHGSVVSLCHWMHGYFGREDLAAMCQSTSLSFDPSVHEIFATLLIGGCVIIVKDIMALADLRPALLQRITFVSTVPSAASELANAGLFPPNARACDVGGEALQESQRKAIAPRVSSKFVNFYGPTETTVECSYSTGDAILTIGNAIPNALCYIVDTSLRNLCPVGVPGELLVGGVGVARGYLKRPELNTERFIPNPFGPGRVYRTGDLVARRADGNIKFIGRRDNQVKIRGKRLELGEVEAAVAGLPNVVDTAVLAVKGELVAFFTTKEAVDVSELKRALVAELPKHMVPSRYYHLKELPLMPNGKFNRHALKRMAEEQPSLGSAGEGEYVAPQDEAEEAVARLFAEVLGKDGRVGRNDKFFDIGGHSIIAVRFVSLVRSELHCDVGLSVLYEDDSVAGFAAAVRAAQHAAAGDCEVAIGSAEVPPVVRPSLLASFLQFVLSPLPLMVQSGTLVAIMVSWNLLAKAIGPFPALAVLPALNFVFHFITLLVWIPLKWLLVGRLKPGEYGLDSLVYLRWRNGHLVETAIKASLAYFQRTAAASFLFRCLGASVGADADIGSNMISDWDLISVGDRAVVELGATLRGGSVRAGRLVLATVRLGVDSAARPQSRCLGGSDIPDGNELPARSGAGQYHPRAFRPIRHSSGVGGLGAFRPTSVGTLRGRLSWWLAKLIVGTMTVAAILPPALPFLLWYQWCDLNPSLCDWERKAMSIHPGVHPYDVLRFFVVLSALGSVFTAFGPLMYTIYCILVKRCCIGRVVRRSTFRELLLWHMMDNLLYSTAMAALVDTRLHAAVWRAMGASIGLDVKLGGDFFCTHPDLVELGDFAAVGGTVLGSLAGSVRRLPVKVAPDAAIGPRCVLLPGTTVGNQAYVVAGSGTELGQHIEARAFFCGAPAVRHGTGRMGRLVPTDEGDLYPWVAHAAPLGQVVDRAVQYHGSVVRYLLCALLFQPACLLPGYMLLTTNNVLFFFLLLPACFTCMAILVSSSVNAVFVGRRRTELDQPLPVWRLAAADMVVGMASQALTPLAGSPLYNLWLRMLGMKMGRGVIYLSPPGSVQSMVTLGDGAVVGRDVVLETVIVRRNQVFSYPSELQEATAVCDGASLGLDVIVRQQSIVTGGSRIDKAGRVAPRRTFSGNPARPVLTQGEERMRKPKATPERSVDYLIHAELPEHIAPREGAYVSAAWDNVFVTGATGFMGSFLLQEIADRYPHCTMHCLVRCNTPQHGMERLRKVLREHKLDEDRVARMCVAIPGDLTKERFGMSAEEWYELGGKLDRIFSVGARVNHFETHAMLRPSHVDAVKQMLELSVLHPQHLVPLHHVSTGSVAVVPEAAHRYFVETEWETAPEVFSLNFTAVGYCQAKIVSENAIVAARERGLPAHVHRIGSLNGDSRNACLNPLDAQTMQLSGWLALGCVAESQLHTDWIYSPVDFACAGLVAVASMPETAQFIHHLFGPHKVTYGDLVRFANAEFRFGIRAVSYQQYRKTIMDYPGELEVRDYERETLNHVERESDYRLGAKGTDFLEQECSQTYTALEQQGVCYSTLTPAYWRKVWIGVLGHLRKQGNALSLSAEAERRVAAAQLDPGDESLRRLVPITPLLTAGGGELLSAAAEADAGGGAGLKAAVGSSGDLAPLISAIPDLGPTACSEADLELSAGPGLLLGACSAAAAAFAIGATVAFPIPTVSSHDLGGCGGSENSTIDCDLSLGGSATWWFEELLNISAGCGALVYAAAAGLRLRLSRRRVASFAALALAATQFSLSGARSGSVALAARVIAGVACGALSCTVPLWLAEAAPVQTRGLCCALYPGASLLGALGAFGFASAAPAGAGQSWRHLATASGVAAALAAVLWQLAPDSPRWLAAFGERGPGIAALRRLRNGPSKGSLGAQYDVDIVQLYGMLRGDAIAAAAPPLRRAALWAVALLAAQRLCGEGIVARHIPDLTRDAWYGGEEKDPAAHWALACFVAAAAAAPLGALLLEMAGRRTALGLGSFTCAAAAAIAAAWYMRGSRYGDRSMALLGELIYAIGGGLGLSIVPWVLSAELCSSGGPATVNLPAPDESAAGVAAAAWWLCGTGARAIWKAAADADSNLHKGRGFALFICAGAAAFVLMSSCALPETRGRTPQSICRQLRGGAGARPLRPPRLLPQRGARRSSRNSFESDP